ncbi:MAG: aspartate kinase [Cyclobacteriaceae bacterium]|nr:aspartate kinase [Cyclobacteriaceae bacterium]UYN86250.1 MAG: aspartate kinase [Cyclobacteriaceae bacterium]
MKVFKFGGASLKHAQAVRNMVAIVRKYSSGPLVIIVSAMDKTTNALEKVVKTFLSGGDFQSEINSIVSFHESLVNDLFKNPQTALTALKPLTAQLLDKLKAAGDEDALYDQVVCFGEIFSSIIVHHYLKETGIENEWLDARELIRTDSTFREGKIDWASTEKNISKLKSERNTSILLTQGFIGSDATGNPTTLGREGSDFSAAIFASCLHAESVTIWKDVPGVMNADPKRLPAAVVFNELPYKEAAEMTYYGASVIHPKTIKPLALKGIPLWVKSFANPQLPGTKIHDCKVENLPPMIVFKDNQCLISCKVTDFTFVNEEQLGTIFHALTELNMKLNVMQNSAISFSFCIDFRENKVMALIEKLQQNFEVYYNTNLTLITIKNYDEPSFETYRKIPGLLLEQSSRSTLQVLVKG